MITFLVPGLSGLEQPGTGTPFAPQCPALNTLLLRSRSSIVDGISLESALFGYFDVALNEDGDAPVASLSRLADLADESGDHWLRADPVHLRADRDHLRFFDANVLGLDMEEANIFATEINKTYAVDGWKMHVAAPDRWYLSIPNQAHIQTHSPLAVVGRVMDSYLPKGPDAMRWQSVMTEMQMLMHMSVVNEQREAKGQFAVNSIWFWGAGKRPQVTENQTQVYSDEPLARGLSMAASAQPQILPRNLYAVTSTGNALFVLDALQRPSVYNDLDVWISQIEAYERDWFAPALEKLKSGEETVITIMAANGTAYEITKAGLRRFWKRGCFWHQ